MQSPKLQQQQSQRNSSSRRRRQRRNNSDTIMNTLLFVLVSCALLSESCSAFSQWQMMAAYKPPVKSSVSKIRSPRWSNSGKSKPQTTMDAPGKDGGLLRPPSKQHASASASLPSTSNKSSFQQRMRGLLAEEKAKVRIATKQKQSMPSNVAKVETLKEYQGVFQGSDKLVVVRFYAPWCRACKAIQPIFYKLASQFRNVQFVDVPCTDKNANLHAGLGVPSLPYCHVYHPICGLVEESKLQRKQIPQLARKLQAYVQGRCDLKQVGDVANPYLPKEEQVATAP